MAVPVLESAAATATDNTTSHVATAPSGIVDNDRLIATVTINGNYGNSTNSPIDGPSGWVRKAIIKIMDGNTLSTGMVGVFHKKAASESGNYTFTTEISTDAAISIKRISGVPTGLVDPFLAINSRSPDDGFTSVVCPPLELIEDDALVIAECLCDDDGGDDTTLPSGYTLVHTLDGGAVDPSLHIGEKDNATAGTVAAATFTGATSADQHLGLHYAISGVDTITFPRLKSNAFSSSGGATSLVVDLPPNVAEGDPLTIHLTIENADLSSTPTGWTVEDNSTNGTAVRHIILSKYAAAGDVTTNQGDATVTVNLTGSDTIVAEARCYWQELCDATDFIEVVGTANTGTSTAPTANAITTLTNNSLVVATFGADDDDEDAAGTEPTGWERDTGRCPISSSFGNMQELAVKVVETAGSSGNAAFTLAANEQWVAVQYAIKPSSGVDPGNSGDVASTLAAPSQAAEAKSDVTGDTGSVLSPARQSLAAIAAITGDVTHLLAPATQSAAGRAAVTGDVVQTLQAASQTLTGTVTDPGIAGDVSSTLFAPSQAAGARSDVTGDVSSALSPATQTIQAVAGITGDVSSVLAAPAQTLSASVPTGLDPVTGDVASTLAPPTQSAAGTATLTGDVVSSLSPASQTVTGAVDVTGDVSQTLQGPFQSLSATRDRGDKTGDVSSALNAPTASIEARADVTGDVSASLAAPSQTISTGAALPGISGDVASVLAALTQHVTALKTGDTGPDALLVSRDDRVIEILKKDDDRTAEVPELRESDIT